MNNHGCYFQTLGGKIVIGKGTYIARNVGIITSNHDVNDPDNHIEGKDVVLGDHTTVGAGSVVTKSFEKGYCVIAGNPARIIRKIETNNLISENN